MRKRQGLIVRVLLGWWLFCLAGQCLSLPLYQEAGPAMSHHMALDMDASAGGHQGCATGETVCEEPTFPAFFLVLAACLPLLLWLGHSAVRRLSLRPSDPFRGSATGPPLYLLSQRFIE